VVFESAVNGLIGRGFRKPHWEYRSHHLEALNITPSPSENSRTGYGRCKWGSYIMSCAGRSVSACRELRVLRGEPPHQFSRKDQRQKPARTPGVICRRAVACQRPAAQIAKTTHHRRRNSRERATWDYYSHQVATAIFWRARFRRSDSSSSCCSSLAGLLSRCLALAYSNDGDPRLGTAFAKRTKNSYCMFPCTFWCSKPLDACNHSGRIQELNAVVSQCCPPLWVVLSRDDQPITLLARFFRAAR
jgi:hypothetical protein